MPAHPATLSDEELLAQCELIKSRTGGPGGQHRNKVQSRVTLSHTPTGTTAAAGERRSVSENRRVALFRLRLALAAQVRMPPRKTGPLGDVRSDLWKSRTTAEGRIVCNPSHHDFPSLLAEALDVIEASAGDERKASLRLTCTVSQLVKLVQKHRPAMVRWNRLREERGLPPLV